MSWPDDVTFTVEWSPSTGPLDTPSWSTLGGVRAFRWRVGRDQKSGEFPPGDAVIVVDNDDRRFDPTNSGSPFAGQLVPGKRIRIVASYGGNDYTRFDGFVDDYLQDRRAMTATLVCSDAAKLLSEWPCPESVWAATVAADNPTGWWPGPVDGSSAVPDRGSLRNPGRLPTAGAAFHADPLVDGSDGGFEFPESFWTTMLTIPPGSAVNGTDFTIEMWVFIPAGAPIPSSRYIYRPEDYELAISIEPDLTTKWWMRGAVSRTSLGRLVRNRPNHIVWTRSGTDARPYLNGIWLGHSSSGSLTSYNETGQRAIEIGMAVEGCIVDEPVVYSGAALDASTVAAHYAAGYRPWDGDDTGERVDNLLDLVGWPAGLRAIDTGNSSTVLGPARLDGSVWDYLVRVAASEAGWLFVESGEVTFIQRYSLLTDTRHTTPQSTWTDEDGAGVHYVTGEPVLDDALVANEVTVTYTGGEVTVEDAASIADHGRRSLTIDTILETEPGARALAHWVLAHHATPEMRVEQVRFNPAGSADAREDAITRRLGDRVTFSSRPQDTGTRFTADMWIDSIEEHVDHGVGTWTIDFGLTPVDEATDYWRWGQSTWDTETVPVY